MEKGKLSSYLSTTLGELALGKKHAARVSRGKVRDMVDLGDRLIITVTDRLSAFDRVLTTIPCKGQVLNELSLFWFEATRSIVPNHIEETLSPRSVIARKCDVLPVEVIVRAYLTGSAWRDYRQGKAIAGIVLPPDMRYNQKFESPVITPSTKAERGAHDEPISTGDVVRRDLVSEPLWRRVEECALALFKAGSEHAARNGLILVDTKYEFGTREGKLVLVDEVHTPDSSRFWHADTYDELYARGEAQRELDKEYLRRWLIERGYMGDGEAPPIPDDIRLETGLRYVTAYERVTGRTFMPGDVDARREAEIVEKAIARLA
ncbi:MAG: phosphoribosylaminoimidazolesuccinocarboxamide synthase [Spirochaetales bacterium]|nr:phosphoribosylaminoimidazolesuccinocarboxamide synthase [Spirochaetales bacterium]